MRFPTTTTTIPLVRAIGSDEAIEADGAGTDDLDGVKGTVPETQGQTGAGEADSEAERGHRDGGHGGTEDEETELGVGKGQEGGTGMRRHGA